MCYHLPTEPCDSEYEYVWALVDSGWAQGVILGLSQGHFGWLWLGLMGPSWGWFGVTFLSLLLALDGLYLGFGWLCLGSCGQLGAILGPSGSKKAAERRQKSDRNLVHNFVSSSVAFSGSGSNS